jgi:hypothetical protein
VEPFYYPVDLTVYQNEIYFTAQHQVYGQCLLRYSFIEDPTGIKEDDAEQFVKIFPNPVEQEFYIRVGRTQIIEKSGILINLQGQRVFDLDLHDMGNGLYVTRIPTSLATGIYFVKLFTGGRSATTKIIRGC